MGDGTQEMDGLDMTRRVPLLARRPALVILTLAVAAAALGLVLLAGGRSGATRHASSSHATSRHQLARHHRSAPAAEINLSALTPQQLRPVGAQVDRAGIRLHPKVVRVAGVGNGDFTAPESDTSVPSSSSSSAHAPSDAEVRRELAAFRRSLRSAPGVPVAAVASVRPDGTAVAPVNAPNVVAAVIQAGNAIARTPYKWGGGHGAWADTGYDCSGSLSFALAGAGLLSSPLDSTGFEHWGAPGPGRWITIYANAGHAFMVVAGLRFDTSGRSGPLGTRWQPAMRSTAGFVARHPPGL
jgi:cell wall-associated NlpC family hydrolase